MQRLTKWVSSGHRHVGIDRFFAENPTQTEAYAYEALEILGNDNFFTRQKSSLRLTIPVLMINGGKDPMFTDQMGMALANQFPQGCHLSLPDAGHLMAEYPEMIMGRSSGSSIRGAI